MDDGAHPSGAAPRGATRRRLGYGVLGIVVVAAVLSAIVLASGSSDGADPHINLKSGSTNGVAPEDRTGIEPPEPMLLRLDGAARAAGCELRLHLRDEGHDHLPPSAVPTYRTDPPTSGDHVEDPYQQADGAYGETPEPSNVVHALEHGRMAIQYSPRLPEDAQRELIGLYGSMYGGTLLYPDDEMPYAVAAVTWTNLLGCRRYEGRPTLEAIRTFGRSTWGRYGGEPVGAVEPAAPTPAKPLASR